MRFSNLEKIVILLLVFLSIPAYFINLGLLPLFADEPTRACVAIEMLLRDNFIVPKIINEFYYKKPPFYNWWLALLMNSTGRYDEFIIRVPALVSLFLFCTTIYAVVKRYLTTEKALLAAFMSLTFGRMLIYDSLLGHIDITYSWLTFMAFYALFYYGEKQKWLMLFTVTYLLSAMAFLSKGFPTILFQGLSLFAYFIWTKRWKMLFSWQHLVGLLVFIIPVGGYFAWYNQYNSLENYFAFLWDQSSQRTVLDKSWWESVANIFTFPLENLGHVAPWSLFFIYFFKRGYWKTVFNTPFLAFTALIFLANIPVYWLSPGYYPRYLFMLYPLLFILASDAYFEHRKQWTKATKALDYFILACIILPMLAIWALPFLPDIQMAEGIWLKVMFLFIGFVSMFFVWQKLPNIRWVAFFGVLLFFKFAFNWFVLPHRLVEGKRDEYRNNAFKIAEITQGHDLRVLHGVSLNQDYIYYLDWKRNTVLRHGSFEELQSGDYVITRSIDNVKCPECEYVMDFYIEYKHIQLNLMRKP